MLIFFREYTVNSDRSNNYVVSFISSDLTHGPAGLSFRKAHDLTHADIWNRKFIGAERDMIF